MIPMSEVRRIITSEIKKSGITFKEIESKSTDSVYFKLFYGEADLLFRVSNHKSIKNIITLRIDRKSTPETIKAFTKNRIKDLSYRKMKIAFNM